MSRTINYAGCTQAEYLLNNTDQIVAYNLLCPLHMSSNLLLLHVQLCRVQSIMPAVLKQSNLLNISDQLSLNTQTITVQYCRI